MTCQVSGWGRTVAGSPASISVTLQEAQVVPVAWRTCRWLDNRISPANIILYLLRYVMGEDRITPGMICAGADGQDTCNGDSGGPMVTRHGQTGGYSAIGITSWGQGCAQPDTLGVYTNIAHHLDWVASQLGYSGVGRGDSQP